MSSHEFVGGDLCTVVESEQSIFSMSLSYSSRLFAAALCISAAACTTIPRSGPATGDLVQAQAVEGGERRIEVIDLSPAIVHQLRAARSTKTFSEGLGAALRCDGTLGVGDTVAVSIWEAPPATLFGGGDVEASSVSAASRMVTLPDQVIDAAGDIGVPFAGRIRAAGLTLVRLESVIVKRLNGKANQPQVMVRLIRNATADVTVVGDVSNSTRLPLTPKCERLLDALAATGGVRQAVDKTTLQVTRGENVYSMPLDSVIRDPKQNVPLRAGDVVTALYQPSSFMAFGATGKNEEIGFEGKGISLAQALARAGGLLDNRADANGVFVFRLEDRSVVAEQGTAGMQAASVERVPTVYRLDLREPSGMFLAQQFEMRDKDALYVSNAPIADIQKLANLFYTIVSPAVSVGTQFK